jgi:hypothetical protein
MTKMTGNATLAINPESYGVLLSKYLPMPITSENDNERALEVVQILMAIEQPRVLYCFTSWKNTISNRLT